MHTQAYIGVECTGPPDAACQHTVDVRSIYKHTHQGFPDHRLALGPHSYLQLAISPAGQGGGVAAKYSVMLHQGGYATTAETAIGVAMHADGKTNLVTYSCRADLFASPNLFVTILCEHSAGGPACARAYDLSFALKKSIIPAGLSGEGATSAHLLPAATAVVLSLPVQAEAVDPLSPYDISLEVESTYPESANVSMGFLHHQALCQEQVTVTMMMLVALLARDSGDRGRG